MIIQGSDGSAQLELSEPEGLLKPDGREYYRVTLRDEGLVASMKVYAFVPTAESLDRFLRAIAENWRGWSDEKRWSSLEGEFRLACTHDGLGHIRFEATLDSPVGWFVSSRVTVAAGDLDHIAIEAARFFKVD
ncbi:MAG TPA: DUF6228 family protein [Pyrinomonadaceae bacterium]|nr:DUF6228 family protein [Pyrinomonadaceae bacterium]